MLVAYLPSATYNLSRDPHSVPLLCKGHVYKAQANLNYIKYLVGLQPKFCLDWRNFMVRTSIEASIHCQPWDDFPGGVSLPQLAPQPELWNQN